MNAQPVRATPGTESLEVFEGICTCPTYGRSPTCGLSAHRAQWHAMSSTPPVPPLPEEPRA